MSPFRILRDVRVFAAAALLGLTVVAPRAAVAQSGAAVRGVVTGAETRTPIFGARVAIENPSRVAVTDDRGRYALRDLPAGSYQIVVTAVGREPSRTTVTLDGSETKTVDIALARGSLMLSSVIVSATRMPTEANQVATTVNVLTPLHIETSPARESQDLLREIPGVELPRTSSNVGGSAQIVSIRGVDEGRTAVLFDGVPITDAWGEWVDWSRVPKALLDRVEVIEGGTSNLYGNGAMGGVIQFFSRPISPGAYRVQLDGGSRDAKHGFVSAGLPLGGPFSMLVTGDYGDGGGYTLIDPTMSGPVDHPSESIRRNALARLEYAPSSNLAAYVTGHYFNDDRDLGSALARTTRRFGSVDFGLDHGALERGRLTIRGWDSEQREDQYNSNITAANGIPRSAEARASWLRIPSHDWGATAQWTRANLFGLQSLSFGADLRHMSGNTSEDDYDNTGAVNATWFSGGAQVLSGAFVQAIAAPWEPLRVELGARVDHWGNNDGRAIDNAGADTSYENRSRAAFSPRLGARWQVVKSFAVHAAGYRAFRAPNLAELYRRFRSGANQNLPNPGLKPEYATGEEVGFDWQPAGWLQLKGTVYSADMRDLNSFVTIAPNTRQRQNVQKTRSRGGEAYLALRPVEGLLLSGSVTYDNARIVDGPPGTRVGARVSRVPMQKQVVRVTYATPRYGTWTVIGRHEGVTTTFSGAGLEPFTVLDANVRREIVPGLTGFVSVENLLDADYEVNLAGTLVSRGMPLTVRAGVEAFRF
jgi:outer membrane cobalamin receptor